MGLFVHCQACGTTLDRLQPRGLLEGAGSQKYVGWCMQCQHIEYQHGSCWFPVEGDLQPPGKTATQACQVGGKGSADVHVGEGAGHTVSKLGGECWC